MTEYVMAELPPPHGYQYAATLSKAEEDALHTHSRLLLAEERPFQLLSDKLLGPQSLLRYPQGKSGEEEQALDAELEAFKRQKFREEVLLRFSALESSLLRIQLVQSSNQRERERYAAEKAKILETAQAVRDNTVELRTQLAAAQEVLRLRKGYDELAGKILDDKKLKSRDDCHKDIEALEREISDLQQESADYENTWQGRREQFDKIVAEGENMVKLIKGIKDEPEPDADGEAEAEGDDEMGEEGTKGESSFAGTPAHGGRTPMHAEGGQTPMLGESGRETPRPDSGDAGEEGVLRNKFLEVEEGVKSGSRAASPAPHTEGDVEMGEGEGEGEVEVQPPKASMGMEASEKQLVEPAEPVGAEKMDES